MVTPDGDCTCKNCLPAHHVEKGDSRVDGPYYDDVENARVAERFKVRNTPPKKKASKSSGNKSNK